MKQLAERLQANSTCRPQLFHLVFIEWIRSVWTVSFPFSLELFLLRSKLLLQIFVLSNIKRLAAPGNIALNHFGKCSGSMVHIPPQGYLFLCLVFPEKKCFSRSLALVLLILDNTSFLPYISIVVPDFKATTSTLSSFDSVFSNVLALELFNFIVF